MNYIRPLINITRLSKHPKSHLVNCLRYSSSGAEILCEKQGSITLIGLNNPDSRNAITDDIAIELNHQIEKFENDQNSSVAVLYGVGGSFCSGYDLGEIKAEGLQKKVNNKFISRKLFTKKPIVCAISGYCVGNGLELALMCDMRIIEESAILGFFQRRFGIPIFDGGTSRLPAMVGMSRALDLVLTGRALTGKEAFDISLASRFVATGTALGQSVNAAVQIAKFPQSTLLHDREMLYNSIYSSTKFDELNQMAQNFPEGTDNICREGADKFLTDNVGKSGKFYDIKKKIIPDWEQEEMDREKNKK